MKMTLSEAIERLTRAGISSALHDARVLFKHFTGARDVDLLDRALASDSPELCEAVSRRESREPLQYIIGEVGFYREVYKVTPDCLIPRADTEILVDYAVSNIPRGARFADLCCGSGCIGISTLKNTEDTTALLADISPAALAIADENCRRMGVSDRAELICTDLLSYNPSDSFFAVLSNPPYVTDDEYSSLEPEIYKEPRAAFVGGADGADFYRVLTPIYKEKIANDGFIAYEIGYAQADIVGEIANQNSMSCEILHDYSGNPRAAILKKARSH